MYMCSGIATGRSGKGAGVGRQSKRALGLVFVIKEKQIPFQLKLAAENDKFAMVLMIYMI